MEDEGRSHLYVKYVFDVDYEVWMQFLSKQKVRNVIFPC
jgi:hypothetical protein